MYKPIKIKICGLTREADVDLALSLGADYFGFIVYPKSPRGISLERAVELSARVPSSKRVLVDVDSDAEQLRQAADMGFEYFQIHTSMECSLASLAAWSGIVGSEHLWLAPRIAPTDAFPEFALEYANTILIDTFHSNQVGGTGQTGDWGRFAKFAKKYPHTQMILAGGLGPSNALSAIASSGANIIDVNSGVEKSPGNKDPVKLREIFAVFDPNDDDAQ